MSITAVLEAKSRIKSTKGAVRSSRKEGQIPAVLYGGGEDPQSLTLNLKQVNRELTQSGFFSRLFELQLEGKKVNALARDIQFHPVTDVPLHVDLLRVSGASYVTVAVPIRFINEDKSPGLKVGGVLNIVLHALEISVQASLIPEELVIDLTGLQIGEVIHLDRIKLPEGSKALHAERDVTVATIVSPSGLNEKAATGADAKEA
ncbi:MAG: 50S ribosomal protein L25/general stress protein Ctc [Alphaproteobacteria bacterium]